MAIPVLRPRKLPKEGCGLSLLSDLHLGSADCDLSLIREELKRAGERGDRVLLNGDVFDLLLPRDSKRYKPSEVHPDLRGRDDVVNAAVDHAVDLLGPYADKIDLIGLGNHESVCTKHHAVDATDLLVRRLQEIAGGGHSIAYGGYCGFVVYTIEGCKQPFRVWYHHGSGSSSTLSSALAEFSRGSFVEGCDAHWFGHKHIRAVSQIERFSCVGNSKKPERRKVWLLRTGSYLDGYSCDEAGPDDRRTSYAVEQLLSPYGRGGIRLVLNPSSRSSLSSFVEVY